MKRQESLFPEATRDPKTTLPDGFHYQPDFLNEAEEVNLVKELRKLELKPFEFHGHLGNRRVVSFGLRYNYDREEVETAAKPPDFLSPLLRKIASFARRKPAEFQQIGINEYRPGAGIGWHRDRPHFGDVVGVSLLSGAKMRLRCRRSDTWIRRAQLLEPRSIYILSGASRRLWEHSVPPVTTLRYSIMFRTIAMLG